MNNDMAVGLVIKAAVDGGAQVQDLNNDLLSLADSHVVATKAGAAQNLETFALQSSAKLAARAVLDQALANKDASQQTEAITNTTSALSNTLQQFSENASNVTKKAQDQKDSVESLTKDYNTLKDVLDNAFGQYTSSPLASGMLGITGDVDRLGLGMVQTSVSADLFDRVLAQIAAHAKTMDMAVLRDGMQKLQEQFAAHTMTDEAQGLFRIITSGVTDTSQALNILTQANKLSLATMQPLPESADAIAKALAKYGKEGLTAASISDLLTISYQTSKDTVKDLGSYMEGLGGSLETVSDKGVSAGVKLQDIMAVFTILAQKGMKTSTAMETVGTMIDAIVSPTQTAREEAAKLHIQFDASTLASKGLAGFLQYLAEKTSSSSTEFSKLFGNADASRAALLVTGKEAEAFGTTLNEMLVPMNATDKALQKNAASAELAKLELKASFSELQREVGTALAPTMNSLSAATNGVTSLIKEHHDAAIVIGKTAAVLGGLSSIVGISTTAFAGLASVFGHIGLATATAAIALGVYYTQSNDLIKNQTLATAATTTLTAAHTTATDVVNNLTTAVANVKNSLADTSNTTKDANTQTTEYNDTIAVFQNAFEQAQPAAQATDDILLKLADDLNTTTPTLVTYHGAWDRITTALQLLIPNIKETQAIVANLSEKYKSAGDSTSAMAVALGKVDTAIQASTHNTSTFTNAFSTFGESLSYVTLSISNAMHGVSTQIKVTDLAIKDSKGNIIEYAKAYSPLQLSLIKFGGGLTELYNSIVYSSHGLGLLSAELNFAIAAFTQIDGSVAKAGSAIQEIVPHLTFAAAAWQRMGYYAENNNVVLFTANATIFLLSETLGNLASVFLSLQFPTQLAIASFSALGLAIVKHIEHFSTVTIGYKLYSNALLALRESVTLATSVVARLGLQAVATAASLTGLGGIFTTLAVGAASLGIEAAILATKIALVTNYALGLDVLVTRLGIGLGNLAVQAGAALVRLLQFDSVSGIFSGLTTWATELALSVGRVGIAALSTLARLTGLNVVGGILNRLAIGGADLALSLGRVVASAAQAFAALTKLDLLPAVFSRWGASITAYIADVRAFAIGLEAADRAALAAAANAGRTATAWGSVTARFSTLWAMLKGITPTFEAVATAASETATAAADLGTAATAAAKGMGAATTAADALAAAFVTASGEVGTAVATATGRLVAATESASTGLAAAARIASTTLIDAAITVATSLETAATAAAESLAIAAGQAASSIVEAANIMATALGTATANMATALAGVTEGTAALAGSARTLTAVVIDIVAIVGTLRTTILAVNTILVSFGEAVAAAAESLATLDAVAASLAATLAAVSPTAATAAAEVGGVGAAATTAAEQFAAANTASYRMAEGMKAATEAASKARIGTSALSTEIFDSIPNFGKGGAAIAEYTVDVNELAVALPRAGLVATELEKANRLLIPSFTEGATTAETLGVGLRGVAVVAEETAGGLAELTVAAVETATALEVAEGVGVVAAAGIGGVAAPVVAVTASIVALGATLVSLSASASEGVSELKKTDTALTSTATTATNAAKANDKMHESIATVTKVTTTAIHATKELNDEYESTSFPIVLAQHFGQELALMGATAARVVNNIINLSSSTKWLADSFYQLAGATDQNSETLKEHNAVIENALKLAQDSIFKLGQERQELDLLSKIRKFHTDALDNEAKARAAISKIAGDEYAQLQAEVKIKEAAVISSQLLATETAKELDLAQQQLQQVHAAIDAKKDDVDAQKALQKSYGEEITKLEQLITADKEKVAAAKASTHESQIAADAARVTAASYGDQSDQVDALREAYNNLGKSQTSVAETEKNQHVATIQLADADGALKQAKEALVAATSREAESHKQLQQLQSSGVASSLALAAATQNEKDDQQNLTEAQQHFTQVQKEVDASRKIETASTKENTAATQANSNAKQNITQLAQEETAATKAVAQATEDLKTKQAALKKEQKDLAESEQSLNEVMKNEESTQQDKTKATQEYQEQLQLTNKAEDAVTAAETKLKDAQKTSTDETAARTKAAGDLNKVITEAQKAYDQYVAAQISVYTSTKEGAVATNQYATRLKELGQTQEVLFPSNQRLATSITSVAVSQQHLIDLQADDISSVKDVTDARIRLMSRMNDLVTIENEVTNDQNKLILATQQSTATTQHATDATQDHTTALQKQEASTTQVTEATKGQEIVFISSSKATIALSNSAESLAQAHKGLVESQNEVTKASDREIQTKQLLENLQAREPGNIAEIEKATQDHSQAIAALTTKQDALVIAQTHLDHVQNIVTQGTLAQASGQIEQAKTTDTVAVAENKLAAATISAGNASRELTSLQTSGTATQEQLGAANQKVVASQKAMTTASENVAFAQEHANAQAKADAEMTVARAQAIALLKDALRDMTTKRKDEEAQIAATNSQLKNEDDLRTTVQKDRLAEIKSAGDLIKQKIEEAKTRGDTTEQTRLESQATANLAEQKQREIAISQAELQADVDQAKGKQQEVEAAQASLKALQDEMQFKQESGAKLTEADKVAIQAAQNLVKSKQDEASASDEVVRHAQDELRQVLATADGSVTAAHAAEKAAASAKFWAESEAVATGAADMMAKALEDIYTEMGKYSKSAEDAARATMMATNDFQKGTAAVADLAKEADKFASSNTQDLDLDLKIKQLEADAKATEKSIQGLNDFGRFSLNDTFGQFFEGIATMQKFTLAIQKAQIEQQKMALLTNEMGEGLSKFKDQLDSGAIGLDEYTKELENLKGKYSALGDERLKPLIDALKQAKDATDSLRQSAEDALNAALQAADATLGANNQVEEEQIAWAKTKADLDKQLADAQKSNDAEAIAAIERAIQIQQAVHDKKMHDLQEEANAQAAAGGAVADTNNTIDNGTTAYGGYGKAVAEATTSNNRFSQSTQATGQAMDGLTGTVATLGAKFDQLKYSIDHASHGSGLSEFNDWLNTTSTSSNATQSSVGSLSNQFTDLKTTVDSASKVIAVDTQTKQDNVAATTDLVSAQVNLNRTMQATAQADKTTTQTQDQITQAQNQQTDLSNKSQAIQDQLDLESKSNANKQKAIDIAIALAQANGDLTKVTDLQNQKSQLELDLLQKQAIAKTQQVSIAQQLVTAKQQEAAADGQVTKEEQASIDTLAKSAKSMQLDADSLALDVQAKKQAIVIAIDLATKNERLAATVAEMAKQNQAAADAAKTAGDSAIAQGKSWTQVIDSANKAASAIVEQQKASNNLASGMAALKTQYDAGAISLKQYDDGLVALKKQFSNADSASLANLQKEIDDTTTKLNALIAAAKQAKDAISAINNVPTSPGTPVHNNPGTTPGFNDYTNGPVKTIRLQMGASNLFGTEQDINRFIAMLAQAGMVTA